MFHCRLFVSQVEAAECSGMCTVIPQNTSPQGKSITIGLRFPECAKKEIAAPVERSLAVAEAREVICKPHKKLDGEKKTHNGTLEHLIILAFQLQKKDREEKSLHPNTSSIVCPDKR